MLLHLFSGFYKPDQGLQTRLTTLILLVLTLLWGGYECYDVGYGRLGYQVQIPDPSLRSDQFQQTPDPDSESRQGGIGLLNGYRLWHDINENGEIDQDDIPLQLGMNIEAPVGWHADLDESEGRIQYLEVQGIDIEPREEMHILLEMLVNDSYATRTEPWFAKDVQFQLMEMSGVRLRMSNRTPLPVAGPWFRPDANAEVPSATVETVPQTQPFRTNAEGAAPSTQPGESDLTTPDTPIEAQQSTVAIYALAPKDLSPLSPTVLPDGTAVDGPPNALNNVRGRIVGRWVVRELADHPVIQATLRFDGMHATDYRSNPLPAAEPTIIPPGAGRDPVTGYQIDGSGIPWMALIALVSTIFFLYLAMRFTMGVALPNRPGGVLSPRAGDDDEEDATDDEEEDEEAARARRKANKEHRREVRKQRKADADKSAKRGLFNRVVEFLIETDREVKLVVWPTQKRVIYSSAVVILCTFLFGLIMFVSDFLLNQILDNLLGIYG